MSASVPDEAKTPAVIRDLNQWQAAAETGENKLRSIDLDLIVTYADPFWHNLWVRTVNSNTPGYLELGNRPPRLKFGDRIHLTGSAIPKGNLNTDSVHVEIVDRGQKPAPLPEDSRVQDLDGRIQKLISVEGFVDEQFTGEPTHTQLRIVANGKRIYVFVLNESSAPSAQWENLYVRATGVYSSSPSANGNQIQATLWVSGPGMLETLRPLAEDPRMRSPAIAIGDLTAVEDGEPVHLRARARSQRIGTDLTIRDETGQTLVQSPQLRVITPGALVDVIGTVHRNANGPFIADGVFVNAKENTDTKNSSTPQIYRVAEDIVQLAPDIARSHLPVQLTGVAAWSAPTSNYFYLLDATRGVRVRLPDGTMPPAIGSSLSVKGVTEAGDYASGVVAEVIQGHDALKPPEPRLSSFELASTGTEEGQWITLTGLVQGTHREENQLVINLTSARGKFSALAPYDAALESLQGSVVTVSGVCVVRANERKQISSFQILLPSTDHVKVIEQALEDPYSLPASSLRSLRQFNIVQSALRRIRVYATVLQFTPGESVWVQDQEDSLHIFTHQTDALQPGDQIDAVGFPGTDGSRSVLREAIYLKESKGNEPPPIPVPNDQFISDRFDGHLARIQAILLESIDTPQGRRLVLQNGSHTFDALIPTAGSAPLTSGSELELTGVYELIHDENGTPYRIQLQLRSVADVQVLRVPSWWTPQRALNVVAVTGAGLLAGLGWIILLRKRVHQQTGTIVKQVEKRAQLEARYREIVENASDLIFTAGLDGRITSLNPAGRHLLGLALDESINRFVHELIAPEEASNPFAPLHLDGSKESITFQSRLSRVDGTRLWLETSARLTWEDGAKIGILGVSRDVSSRKRNEEELTTARNTAEENARAKSMFLANMSHEIRTPMNGVIGMSNLLLETTLEPDQKEFAETIRNSAEALLTILNDILDFSKIEAGKLQFEQVDFDLTEVVESTIELLASRAFSKGLEITSFIDPTLPQIISGDPGRLRQVMLNLIGNAIKFTATGEVAVEVLRQPATGADVTIKFEIRDTGIGLPEAARKQLFQPFVQADASTTRKFGGTGLGLAISKQIVEIMGGAIGVDSCPGQGSTFWFTATFQPPIAPVTSTATDGDPISFSDIHCLIVDAHLTSRTIIHRYLSAVGAKAVEVSSGAEALALLHSANEQQNPFTLILVDHAMPGMDGTELSRRIRSHPSTAKIPIILLSPLSQRLPKTTLEEIGLCQATTKPIRRTEMAHTLERALGRETKVSGNLRPSTKETNLAPAGKSLKILVAEDNPVNQRVAQLQLTKLGHRSEAVANGLEVLEALQRTNFDLILMDCQMPEMDGYGATKRIREGKIQPAIPIVAMTANAMEGDREHCLKSGMNDYVSKPIRVPELKAALERMIVLQNRSGNPVSIAIAGKNAGQDLSVVESSDQIR